MILFPIFTEPVIIKTYMGKVNVTIFNNNNRN